MELCKANRREALEETIRLDGVSLRVVDTAGIRSTEDIVEKIGVEKARKYALDADLLIYIVDVNNIHNRFRF